MAKNKNADDTSKYEPEKLNQSTGSRDDIIDYPSPVHDLYRTDSRQTLADFFIKIGDEWNGGAKSLSKSEIMEKTGLTRRSIIDHIGTLIELGIVEVVEGDRYNRYKPAIDNPAYEALHAANEELYKNKLLACEQGWLDDSDD